MRAQILMLFPARAMSGLAVLSLVTVCAACGGAQAPPTPWTHFGDGKNMIDMQLTPGKHTLTVQIGDDMHRTIEGLCKTISVTVQ